MAGFFCKNHSQQDFTAEWCKALELKIVNINGDGHCLYTCLGKALDLNGNEVRSTIVEQSNIYWNDTVEFDQDGEEYINFLVEAADINEWGGARQVAIFARIAK
eukprot:4813662-Heterocapsa_arctica.AAC.1